VGKQVPKSEARVEWAIHHSAEWDKKHPDTKNTISNINKEISKHKIKKKCK